MIAHNNARKHMIGMVPMIPMEHMAPMGIGAKEEIDKRRRRKRRKGRRRKRSRRNTESLLKFLELHICYSKLAVLLSKSPTHVIKNDVRLLDDIVFATSFMENKQQQIKW